MNSVAAIPLRQRSCKKLYALAATPLRQRSCEHLFAVAATPLRQRSGQFDHLGRSTMVLMLEFENDVVAAAAAVR